MINVQGVRLELCAYDRVGLLSDITRVLRENGLAVVRADVATQGEKAVNVFYVRDISGNNVDLDLVRSMTREMGAIGMAVTNYSQSTSPSDQPTSSNPRPRPNLLSIGEMLKSQIERFVPIK